jgi:Flp pilus assembly protein TadD
VAGLVSVWFQHRTMMPAEMAAALPPVARAALVGKAIWFYLGKAWFPYPLVMIYPRWQLLPTGAADLLPLAMLLSLCAAVAWLAVRRGWRGPAAALAYFCLSLLPVTGLFNMTFYALSYVSDHLVYVALLSMCTLCAAVLSIRWKRRVWRRISATARVAIVAACGVLTWQRAGDFGSAERLWRNTVALNPTSVAAQNNYGVALKDRGQLPAAEACFRTAVGLGPRDPAALTSLATLLRQEDRWPEAAQIYRRLLAGPAEPEDYNNYGVVLLYLGDSAQAAAQFRQALSLDPTLSSAHFNLYKLALAAGDQAAAAAELTRFKVGMALRAGP